MVVMRICARQRVGMPLQFSVLCECVLILYLCTSNASSRQALDQKRWLDGVAAFEAFLAA